MRSALLLGLLVSATAPAAERTVTVADHLGIPYQDEPVSFDWVLPRATPRTNIGIVDRASQVEILEGDAGAVRHARIWTTVSFPFVDGKPGDGAARHLVLTLSDQAPPREAACPITVADAGERGGVPLALLDNGHIRIVVPQGETVFERGASGLDLPGPVHAIARGAEGLTGSSWIDCIDRVLAVRCQTERGSIYHQTTVRYEFASGRSYTSRVRLYRGKSWVQLVEDFDLGGNARYVFNYDDWPVDGFFRPGDSNRYGWRPLDERNPCGDFVTIPGQRALARLVVWSQFNYFAGKQETIALKQADPEVLQPAWEQAVAKADKDLAKWQAKQEEWQRNPPRKGIPPRPTIPERPVFAPATVSVDGVSLATTTPLTPPGAATAIGAFHLRPDRWTRAKVNHVDLYLRPEVPGQPVTRGVTGLAGSVLRPAMEAWLVDGHREWALFAVAAGDRDWLTRAHIQEGVWPLDRLNRLPLVWNSDGSPVAPADTVPGDQPAGGPAAQVMKGTGGRSGLQYFNGSNPHIRGRRPKAFSGEAATVRAGPDVNTRLAEAALQAWFAADDSAYPSRRAMLPWSHPEALNPFYQGMENMNFNADLYRWICAAGYDLKRLGHPEAERFIAHARDSFDLALDTYVYPQSGCWEESHGYAGHTVGVVTPLATALRDSGERDFFDDPRLLAMVHFFTRVYSPFDSAFGNRVVPPIGDHGLSRADPAERLGKLLEPFAEVSGATTTRQLGEIAALVAESSGPLPDGVTPRPGERLSGWLAGYGSVLHAPAPGALWRFELSEVLRRSKDGVISELVLIVPERGGKLVPHAAVLSPNHNRGQHSATLRFEPAGEDLRLIAELGIGEDKWVKAGGSGRVEVLLRRTEDGWTGSFTGSFSSEGAEHPSAGELRCRRIAPESFCVLRAGQSWGHHHEDKGSLWFWGRGAHFFGDASWGGPPGGTYGNPFKQGPASGTQIELEGITNWTLPCKYPAPWIADADYGIGVDYALARCLYPFNPEIHFEAEAPVALSQGYDRHLLFVHPDLLVVHDHVDTACPTVWRLHSYQPESTTVAGAAATLASPCGVSGELRILYPPGAELTLHRTIPEGYPAVGASFGSSALLEWRMPRNASATWSFLVHDQAAAADPGEVLDEQGRVTRHVLQDGRVVIAFLSGERFAWQGEGLDFAGTVGVAIRDGDGNWDLRGIRGELRRAP